MSRFTEYNDMARSGQGLVLERHVELAGPDGTLLATTNSAEAINGVALWRPQVGDLDLDPGRVLSRSMAFDLVAPSLGVPSRAGDPLHPETASLIRLKAGLAGGPLWTLATLLVSELRGSVRRGLTTMEVLAVDPGRPLRADLTSSFAWDAGEAVEAVVARLVGLVVPGVEVAASGYVMPAAGSYPAGRQIYALAEQLVGSVGQEITADANGRIFTRQVPPSTADATERWSYGVSGGGLPIDEATRTWTVDSPQGVVVEGASLLADDAATTVEVWDTDPSSSGYFRGPGEVSLETVSYDHVASPSQMAVAGYARLRQIGVGPALVSMEVAPNPAMQLHDLVELWLPALRASGLFRVRSIRMPDRARGLQTVNLRAVWDPELNYVAPADPVPSVCVTSATDSFNRANENLEDLVDSPGSPRWTELGYSWAVYGNRAVQRFNGGWSLALWNTPICSTNVIATATIGTVPSGKYVGPAIRSSGQFDGYAALVDSAGRVSLEMWQAGARVEVLASTGTGSSPAGKTLAVKAVGSTITVLYQGAQLLSVVDSRRAGPYVGMLGFGGTQGSTAPSIDAWSAAVTT